MLKQFFTSIIVLMCLSTILTQSVDGQSLHLLEIDIPFQFALEDKILPAGKYTFERLDSAKPSVLLLKNKDSGRVNLVITQRVERDNPSGASSLVFIRRDGKTQLYQVWTIGAENGNQVQLAAEKEKRNQTRNGATLVTLRSKSP